MSATAQSEAPVLPSALAGSRKLRCSFCGRRETDVRKLISGVSGGLICDGCVASCVTILDDDQAASRFSDPDLARTQTLLDLLEGENVKDTIAREALQRIVDELRRRKVSWAVIGAALGVTRQAAWGRFGGRE
jgi:hypothetical protein